MGFDIEGMYWMPWPADGCIATQVTERVMLLYWRADDDSVGGVYLLQLRSGQVRPVYILSAGEELVRFGSFIHRLSLVSFDRDGKPGVGGFKLSYATYVHGNECTS